MPKRYIKRYESFCKSFANLDNAKYQDMSNQYILTGIIGVFNLTFDLAWKVMKDVLDEEYGIIDFPSGSPRETLKKSFSVGLIEDDRWLRMLNDRNDLTHTYDYEIAKESVDIILNEYVDLFSQFKIKVENLSVS